jgi:tRNA(Ile)-lysidine synthase
VTVRDVVERAIRRHGMLAGGETVLVGVSGGADSVALLRLLLALAPAWRLALRVLHVDHGLRPESPADADFVRSLGRRLGVPVEVARVEVDPRGSREAAARAARHAALEAGAERLGAQRIALGHTADDQAETVIMRLLAGAGVRGLAGIPPVRGRIIRPLLSVRRRDLEEELRQAGLAWVEDPSNRSLKFSRNRIRHEVLPWLAASYGAGVVDALERVATRARETVEAIERVAAAKLSRLATTEPPLARLAAGGPDVDVAEPEAIILSRSGLTGLPTAVAVEVLRQAVARLGNRAPLRAWGHRGLARVVAPSRPRRPFRLGGVSVEVSGDFVRLGRRPAPALPERTLSIPGRAMLPEVALALEAAIAAVGGRDLHALTAAPAAGGGRDGARVVFDAARLPPRLVVRARRSGDRFTPFGAVGERRLKSFLIDAKVPRWDRRRVPIVEAAGEIVWVGGLRRGTAAPLTEQTTRVVELRLVPL